MFRLIIYNVVTYMNTYFNKGGRGKEMRLFSNLDVFKFRNDKKKICYARIIK